MKDALKKLEEQLAGETEKTKSAEEKLAAEVSKNSKLKSELIDAKDEVKMNKVATKKNAKDALEVESLKEKAVELEKEVVRLKSLAEAHEREAAALEVLRTELNSKTAEMSALMKRNELLASEASANSYELEKTKQERSNLMAHYENKFKGLQNDLDKERSRKTEEVMARATPTKATNELKERLRREEEKVSELRAELGLLQKQADERSALHERELKRAKQASERTADMYREQNVVLQRQWREESVRTGVSSNEVSTLEADDSRTGDDSIVGGTPVVVKKTRGRGRGKATKLGNRTTSNESQHWDREEGPGDPQEQAGTQPPGRGTGGEGGGEEACQKEGRCIVHRGAEGETGVCPFTCCGGIEQVHQGLRHSLLLDSGGEEEAQVIQHNTSNQCGE